MLIVSNGNANINLSLQLSATGFACPAQLCSCCVHEILQTGPLVFISQDTTLIQGLHFQPVFLILLSLFLLTLKQEIRLIFFTYIRQCNVKQHFSRTSLIITRCFFGRQHNSALTWKETAILATEGTYLLCIDSNLCLSLKFLKQFSVGILSY